VRVCVSFVSLFFVFFILFLFFFVFLFFLGFFLRFDVSQSLLAKYVSNRRGHAGNGGARCGFVCFVLIFTMK
jgi:hypothetical protein